MRKLIHTLVVLAGLAAGQAASALTISASGGAPNGVNLLNFDDLKPTATDEMVTTGPAGNTVKVNITPNGQVASGSSSGIYAAPFLSGNNGAGFGNANGLDTTPYLTSGSLGGGGSVTLIFSTPQQYFGLLWGSIDPDNKLEFFDSANKLVATVLGADVTKSANGDQGVNGTLYVNIDYLPAYSSVKATSPNFAFEFDNVAYSARPVGLGDGGRTLILFGLGLLGIIVVSRWLHSKGQSGP